MRTKQLLLMAAALAAGITASQAQVYSLNAVGYINVPVTNGFNLVGNQLDWDGTGTNNTLQTVFGSNNLPVLTQAYAFTNGGYLTATYSGSGKWTGNTNAANYSLQPGRGIFIKWPSAGSTNIVLTGTVMQGTALSNTVPLGFQFISSQVAQGGKVQTDLGLSPGTLDQIFQWTNTVQKWGVAHTRSTSTNWTGGGEPILVTSEAVMYSAHAGAKWVRNFSVQ